MKINRIGGHQLEITEIDKSFISEATQRFESKPVYNGSFMSGKRTVSGFLMEILCNELINKHICDCTMIGEEDFDADLLANGCRIDVKTNRSERIRNLDEAFTIFCDHGQGKYKVNISKQKTDFFICCSCNKDLSKAWINGFASAEYIIQNSTKHLKGELYHHNSAYTRHADGYDILITNLIPLKKYSKQIFKPKVI